MGRRVASAVIERLIIFNAPHHNRYRGRVGRWGVGASRSRTAPTMIATPCITTDTATPFPRVRGVGYRRCRGGQDLPLQPEPDHCAWRHTPSVSPGDRGSAHRELRSWQ